MIKLPLTEEIKQQVNGWDDLRLASGEEDNV
jgi:hypothetical protein